MEISFRDEAWISVKADGAPVFAGLAPKGARQDWKARRSLTLRTPDPAGLTLTLNGSPRALPAADEAGEYKIELP